MCPILLAGWRHIAPLNQRAMMRCSQTRSPNVRGLLLADVDMGRRLRVIGKGSKERHVPVDAAFFTELAAYLRWERPPGLAGSQCFVAARINLTLAEDFT